MSDTRLDRVIEVVDELNDRIFNAGVPRRIELRYSNDELGITWGVDLTLWDSEGFWRDGRPEFPDLDETKNPDATFERYDVPRVEDCLTMLRIHAAYMLAVVDGVES